MLKESSLFETDPTAFQYRQEFPELLKCDDIRYSGQKPIRNLLHLGIIGTRRPNRESLLFLRALFSKIQKWPLRIISGGALGVDAQSHAEALRHKIPTYAWVVGDPCLATPYFNRRLFEAIQRAPNSAIITPNYLYRHKNHNLHHTFWIERNYWIAANCDALLVLQAKKKSGTWWTVKACQEFGIPVFAVPGNPLDPNFEGNNLMISRSFAEAVTTIDELTHQLVTLFSKNISHNL